MSFDLDFGYLNGIVNPDPNKIPYLENKDRFVRVAFDLFKMRDGGEELWQVQADDDGNEFLVKTYNEPEEQVVEASDWKLMLDKTASNITVAYKDIPIHRIATADYGAESVDDAHILKNAMRDKLATDASFVEKFVRELPFAKQKVLAELAGGPPPIPEDAGQPHPWADEPKEDVDEFLASLPEEEKKKLYEKLDQMFGGVETSAPENV